MSIIKSRIFIRALFLLFLFTPTLSFAAGNIGFDGLNNLILSFANGVVRSTGYMMFTLAVVAFFFGIVQFIWSARQGSEGKGIQRGTQFMKWGLIALFVMFSVWGIIKFAQGVFGIQGDNTIIVPSLNFIQSGGDNTAGTVTKLAAGVGCTNTNQCASGLTCVGNNATSKVCTASGSQSCVAPKVWVNGNCTTPAGNTVVNGGGNNAGNGNTVVNGAGDNGSGTVVNVSASGDGSGTVVNVSASGDGSHGTDYASCIAVGLFTNEYCLETWPITGNGNDNNNETIEQSNVQVSELCYHGESGEVIPCQ